MRVRVAVAVVVVLVLTNEHRLHMVGGLQVGGAGRGSRSAVAVGLGRLALLANRREASTVGVRLALVRNQVGRLHGVYQGNRRRRSDKRRTPFAAAVSVSGALCTTLAICARRRRIHVREAVGGVLVLAHSLADHLVARSMTSFHDSDVFTRPGA